MNGNDDALSYLDGNHRKAGDEAEELRNAAGSAEAAEKKVEVEATGVAELE